MKGLCLAGATLALLLVACGDDEPSPGARAACAAGGELTDCPDAERTPEEACWRLVDCGAISIRGENENSFNWGRCVDFIETETPDRERLVINCIAASTCDQLRVNGSPQNPNTNQMYCIQLGRDY